MADTSLIFSIVARDKTTGVMKKIQAQASSTGSIVSKALGPALAPVAAVGGAAVLGLGAALASAGAAAGVFGAVVATSMTEVSESATKFQDLRDKMDLYGKQAELAAAAGKDNEKYLKKQAEAALELKARMALLPPETRKATSAFMDMKSDWKDFVEANQPATFNTLTNGYKLVGQAVLKLQPFFDIGKRAADRLLLSLTKMVQGGGLDRLAKNAGPAMESLTNIIINVGTAVTKTFGKFAGQGQGVLKWIENATAKWADWASSTEQDTGLNKFFNYVSQNGPAVIAALTSLATAALHIYQAISPLAPVSLAVATALAAIISAIPPGVITALVTGFLAFNVALKAYAVYTAIATAVQWANNVAMLASPVTWIVLAIVALVAIIVLVATKTKFFQTIWGATWSFMKGVGAWFAGPFANFFVMLWNKIVGFAKGTWNAIKTYFGFWYGMYNKIGQWAGSAVKFMITKLTSFVKFVTGIPGRIGGALGRMFRPMWDGFRGFVNRIIGGWNRLSFGLPGFSFAGINVPGVSIGTPDIPYLARGGHVKEQGLAFIHRGETVTPAAKVSRYNGGGGGGTITIRGDGSKMSRLLLELLREAIRDKGGDPVKVLTPAS